MATDERWRRIAFSCVAVLGIALLLTGLQPFNAINVAIGIADLVLAAAFLLLEPVARRSARRLISETGHAEHMPAGEHAED